MKPPQSDYRRRQMHGPLQPADPPMPAGFWRLFAIATLGFWTTVAAVAWSFWK